MGTAAKTRRSDRQQARQTKKADIQSGDSRQEAKDAKHAIKSTDRAQWKADGNSIGITAGTTISDAAKDVAKDIADNPEDLV
jgi:hypothetical protein